MFDILYEAWLGHYIYQQRSLIVFHQIGELMGKLSRFPVVSSTMVQISFTHSLLNGNANYLSKCLVKILSRIHFPISLLVSH